MTLRTRMLAVADRVRAVAGPDRLDQRPHRLEIVTRVWSGGYKDAGTPVDTVLAMPGHLRVREVSTREVAGSGGRYEIGDVRVDGITPAYGDLAEGRAKGYAPAALDPVVTKNGTEVIYRLTGARAGDYQLVDLETWRPYQYALLLRRRLGGA